MIYELRTYQVVPGRMKELNDRFANITVRLFEKHGMKVVGFWETAIGEATTTELIYMLAFEDLGHYQRAWDAFIADPEWQEAKQRTEVNGPLVNVAGSKIIEPTDYSPMQ
ncbi:MAG: NIPSNAP family protein [Candidatus Poribacteria bacterium]|nr:NIPSNAP family protein [Candidatus Poribacteria bacterium]